VEVAAMAKSAEAFSYGRFSTPEQRKGHSKERQAERAAEWCRRNGVRLNATTFFDPGRSGFLGEHRKNPDRHALAAFLKLVEEDKIPKGSFLIIESLDRLTREHVRAGLMLCLGLIEKGIRIVQLSPNEVIYDEKSDEMSLMLMIVELSRGHGESKRKSDLSGPAWAKKKRDAREGKIVTRALPAWVKVHGDRLACIPERAAVVAEIFQLAANGYGMARIVSKLTRDKVPCFGKTGKWGKAYIGRILRDRRAVGEYQPRRGKKRLADGDPVPDYFPQVVTEQLYYAARAGAAERGTRPGRIGEGQINIFAGLLKNARDGEPYFLTGRNEGKGRYHVLINASSEQGRGPCFSFPYLVFERAVLEKLAEIDPREIVGGDNSAVEVAALEGELATVEAKTAELEAELLNGSVASLARVLRQLEARKSAIASKLDDARAKAVTPVSESWGACQSLMSALEGTEDEEDAWLRLRSALRRIVEKIWLLVVPKKLHRIAAVQMYFTGNTRRDYLIYHKPPHVISGRRKEGGWWVRSLKSVVTEDGLDLRKREDALRLEQVLSSVDLKVINNTEKEDRL
jgi:DNA invertase Pin-like site-specific DNA recombinase